MLISIYRKWCSLQQQIIWTHPRPLLDRMELIEVSGYTQEEKVEIARKHLVPKEIENHGLKPDQVLLSKAVLQHMIESYTRESGVRELNRQVAALMRKIAKLVANQWRI